MDDNVSRLRDLASTLNRESDSLNTRIAQFEAALYDLRLGLEVETAEPIRKEALEVKDDPRAVEEVSTYLWWGKTDQGWRLCLRHYLDDGERVGPRYNLLRDASREDRIAAVAAFRQILEAMKEHAASVIAEIQEAKKTADAAIEMTTQSR